LKPDVVVAVNLGGSSQPGGYFPFLDQNGLRADFNAVAAATRSSAAALAAGGRHVVLVELVPIPGDVSGRSAFFDPYKCVQKSKVDEECCYRSDPSPTQTDILDRDVAASNDKIFSLDLDRQVCPLLPICDPVVNGEIVKMNPSHLRAAFAATVAPYVDTYLKSVGLLPK